MAKVCHVCGGRGKFVVVLPDWSEPKVSPPYYMLKSKEVELICRCCEGRGGTCGC